MKEGTIVCFITFEKEEQTKSYDELCELVERKLEQAKISIYNKLKING